MEEKILQEEAPETTPETSAVSVPDDLSESSVITVSGNDIIIAPGAQGDPETVVDGGTGNVMLVPYTVLSESSDDLYPVYDTYEEFMASPMYVTRYEYELLGRMEFIQYALAIVIALLFLLIFKKK